MSEAGAADKKAAKKPPKKPPFVIGGQKVGAGERATVELPVAKLYTHADMALHVHVVNGKRPGPTLFVSATIHGDEINGVEIIRRVLKSKALDRVRGTILAVPVVNPFGLIMRSRYLPDRRDLNRAFPGSPNGSLARRIAHLFMTEIVARSTHGIDLHTASNFRTNLPQIRTSMDDAESLEMARAFGSPIILDAKLRDGSLRQSASENGVPTLLYEAGEAFYFNQGAIKTGVRGVMNVMRHIGMLARGKAAHKYEPVESHASSWIRAVKSGLFTKVASLGDSVQKNQVLGVITDTLGEEAVEIKAPFEGVVISTQTLPLVHEGDALIHLARVKDMESAEESMETYAAELTDDDYSLER